MTDTTPLIFSLPKEILLFMASYLTLEELGQFRQVCKAFYTLGSNASLLQPHYNRVKALDPSLPALLPTDISPPLAFKQAFEKVRDAQIKEITYLTKHHPTLVAQHICAALAQTPTTLEQLEKRNSALDAINSPIIESAINAQGLNRTTLDLDRKRITRLPISLLKKPDLVQFWQNLTRLYCSNNALNTLNLQDCSTLKYLFCENNTLTTLNLQGLTALQTLTCCRNALTTLTLQGCSALRYLYCENNRLTTLHLQGCSALHTLYCLNNTLTSLNLQGLTALQTLWCSDNALTSLKLQGCSALQTLYCDKSSLTELNLEGTPEKLRAEFAPMIETLRVQQLARPSLNQAPNFLPAFNDSAAPLPPQSFKRPAEENSDEEKSVNQDSDSKAKRQKP